MGRILAVDYGRKRVGIAVSDPLKIIANGLATVKACEAVGFIASYVGREDVERIVIGLPRQASGEESESMKYIRPFVENLKKKISLPIEFEDERFTSVLAHQAMRMGGLRRKDRQNKALVDEMSATIILQSYMERIRN